MQVGAVQGSAKHPIDPRVIGVEKSLGGDAVGNEPHTQEKEEEENVLHLQNRKTRVFIPLHEPLCLHL